MESAILFMNEGSLVQVWANKWGSAGWPECPDSTIKVGIFIRQQRSEFGEVRVLVDGSEFWQDPGLVFPVSETEIVNESR